MRLPTAFLIAGLIAAAASAQISTLRYEKRGTYAQTSNSTLVPFNDWIATINVIATYSNATGVTIDGLPGMQRVGLSLEWRWNSSLYPTRQALDTTLPSSRFFQLRVARPNLEEYCFFQPSADAYPDRPPTFTGDAYDRMQSANPNEPIALSVDGFTPAADGTPSQINLQIYDLDRALVVYDQTLPTAAPSTFVVPIGTLRPETAYYLQASYSGVSIQPLFISQIAGSDSHWTLRTQLVFITRRCIADLTGDSVSDLEDFFAFFNCWDLASPCADIDGAPGLDLGDFFAFFNAFDEAC